jgi:dephospho-CoA kinase
MADREIGIGLIGLPNAGKGEVQTILAEYYDFQVLTASSILREIGATELHIDPKDVPRGELRRIRGELGDEKLSELVIQRVKRLGPRVVIDGIRQVILRDRLKRELREYVTIAIKADIRRRLMRAQDRFNSQGRFEPDEQDTKGFIRTDCIELGLVKDNNGQSYEAGELMRRADISIRNNGNKEELRQLVDYVMHHHLNIT